MHPSKAKCRAETKRLNPWKVNLVQSQCSTRVNLSQCLGSQRVNLNQETTISPEDELRELKRSYAKLQIELRKERMRADLLDEMINVGESMFKVPIRKKAGAKQ